jgi:acetolactate synthase I/II/III large subunit
MMRLATAVGQVLADGGITTAFGVVGNGNALAIEGLIAGGVRYVAARHEGGAIVMADAYYRVTGDVAVCTTTYGPGLTNAATGLADAVKQRNGVLLLCGDGPTSGARAIDIDQERFVAALGAATIRLTDPANAQAAVAEALQLARSGSRPVVLSLPSDRLSAQVGGEAGAAGMAGVAGAETAVGRSVPGRWAPATVEVEAVLDLLATCRRPLLLAGLGAWRSRAGKPIAALADRLGALLTTTVLASALFGENPWSLGVCGGFAAPRAARIISRADAVVSFGASLSDFTLHGGRMFRADATVVQVDLREDLVNARVDLRVRGDAAETACALLGGVIGRGLSESGWRRQVAGELERADWEHEPYDDASTADLIDPRTLSRVLARLLPEPYTLVTDGGHFVGWPAMYWPVPDPSALVFTGAAFQSVGLGFGGAVGAAVGRPDRTIVVALGDGGALMGLPDLETLIRTARSALVVIYNDSAYGAEVHLYQPLGIDTSPARFGDTDFAGLARSMGATAATVRSARDLSVLHAWREHGCRGTLVLDCKVVPDVIAPYMSELRGHIRAGGE